jgi:dihydroneopterin aldolase/2-amino-4-hydroxy-6-hydroxymethyldihydropteridine diphosphokinase
VLSLGSNLGDRLAHLQGALDQLVADGELCPVAVSAVYETAPVGGPEQPHYLNAVLLVETALPPEALLRWVNSVEDALGRIRRERWGPRVIDIDIIAVGDQRRCGPVLTVPHPRAYERAFVLAPWLDVDPDAALPARGMVADLLTAAGRGGVRRCPTLHLRLPA